MAFLSICHCIQVRHKHILSIWKCTFIRIFVNLRIYLKIHILKIADVSFGKEKRITEIVTYFLHRMLPTQSIAHRHAHEDESTEEAS